MRIAEVRAQVLETDLCQPFAWSFDCTAKRGARLVEIVGEDGTTGWGECFGPAALNAAVIGAFRPHLLGAAALQLIAALAANPPHHTPLAPMLEFDRSEHPFRQAVLAAPIKADAGMVAVPEAVGLGIAIDRGALERFHRTPDR